MKIAYISLHWPRASTSSVGKKIDMQINAWHDYGHQISFFSHMHTGPSDHTLLEGRKFIYEFNESFIGCLKTEFSRIRAAKELIEQVRLYQPDLIYLRWAMYVFPIHRLVDIAPVILEINTNDALEHRLLGTIMNFYNRITRGITLGNADGLVFTTEELAELDVFTKFDKPYQVVPNSVNLSTTPFYSAPDNDIPHLVFIGTPGLVWQGIDKLVNFAVNFSDIHVDIIGYREIPGFKKIPDNITLHGYLDGKAFEKVLSRADAAVGTLALHRKGMEEAAPLKIRDCLARGIPCILPYTDTDLKNIRLENILRVPNTPENVEKFGGMMHDFIYQMKGKRISRESLKGLIDSCTEEKERLVFFEKIRSIHRCNKNP